MQSNKAHANTFLKGLNKDVDKSLYPSDSYLHAENIRIVSDSNNTFGAVENIKGNTLQVSLPTGHTIIGTCTIRDVLVIFSVATGNMSYIYKATLNTDGTISNLVNIYTDSNKTTKLNFNVNNKIKAVGYYETEFSQKVYFTDNLNPIRFFNLADTNLANLLPTQFEFNIKGNLYEAELDSILQGTGELKSGVIQYTYRLYRVYGQSSVFAPLSRLYHITKYVEGVADYRGSVKDKICNKTYKVKIQRDKWAIGSSVFDLYDKIQVYSIHYSELNGVAEIRLISDEALPETGDYITSDYGQDLGGEGITLDEILEVKDSSFICRDLEVKNNHLFSANIKETYFELDGVDTRAYRWEAFVNTATSNSLPDIQTYIYGDILSCYRLTKRYDISKKIYEIYKVESMIRTNPTSTAWVVTSTISSPKSLYNWGIPDNYNCINYYNNSFNSIGDPITLAGSTNSREYCRSLILDFYRTKPYPIDNSYVTPSIDYGTWEYASYLNKHDGHAYKLDVTEPVCPGVQYATINDGTDFVLVGYERRNQTDPNADSSKKFIVPKETSSFFIPPSISPVYSNALTSSHVIEWGFKDEVYKTFSNKPAGRAGFTAKDLYYQKLGGSGPIIRYDFTTSIDLNSSPLHPISFDLRGFKRGEVYRFYIQFRNSAGAYSFSSWVSDIRMPEAFETDGKLKNKISEYSSSTTVYNDSGIQLYSNGDFNYGTTSYIPNVATYNLYINFYITDTALLKSKDVLDFRILYEPVNTSDKSRPFQGILGQVAYVNDLGEATSKDSTIITKNKPALLPEVVPVVDMLNTTPLESWYGVPLDSGWVYPNAQSALLAGRNNSILYYIYPELLFNNEHYALNGTFVQQSSYLVPNGICINATSSLNLTSNRPDIKEGLDAYNYVWDWVSGIYKKYLGSKCFPYYYNFGLSLTRTPTKSYNNYGNPSTSTNSVFKYLFHSVADVDRIQEISPESISTSFSARVIDIRTTLYDYINNGVSYPLLSNCVYTTTGSKFTMEANKQPDRYTYYFAKGCKKLFISLPDYGKFHNIYARHYNHSAPDNYYIDGIDTTNTKFPADNSLVINPIVDTVINVDNVRYGGILHSNRESSTLVPCSLFNSLYSKTNSGCVCYGDTNVSYFYFNHASPQNLYFPYTSINYNINPYHWQAHKYGTVRVLMAPVVETSLNLRLRHDKILYNSNFDLFVTDSSGNKWVVPYQYDTNLNNSYKNQETDLYLYNSVYSKLNTTARFSTKPLDWKPSSNRDCLIKHSEKKINGEIVDSFTTFKTGNQLEVDSKYGWLSNIVNYNNQLYFYQQKAFGALAVYDRQLAQDINSTKSLVLGTGGVLDRYDYISTTTGNSELFGVAQGKSGLYWYDRHNKEIIRFGQSSESLSKTKSIQSLCNNISTNITSVVSTVDRKFNEVLTTIKYKTDKVSVNTVAIPYSNNGDVVFELSNPTYLKSLTSPLFYYNDTLLTVIPTPNFVGKDNAKYYITVYSPNFGIGAVLKVENALQLTIVFNESADYFTGLYTFHPNIYISNSNYYYSIGLNNHSIYMHNSGSYGSFYGSIHLSKLSVLVNPEFNYTKAFDTTTFFSSAWNGTVNVEKNTFDTVRFYNDYQNTDYTTIDTNNKASITRRERGWAMQIPRNRVISPINSNPDIFSEVNLSQSNRMFGERLRDKYLTMDLVYNNSNNYRFNCPYIITNYRLSYR